MEQVIYSVKQFNELINTVLSTQVGEVTVTGEVSGYQVRQNKWVSFDLKDNDSVVNCFTTMYQLDFPLEDGQEILVTGTPRIYVPYGKFSLNVRNVQLKGEGALQKAFEALKLKLEQEGLFALEHKLALPRFPESIGIITSSEGAAINDIIKVINRRWGGLKLFLLPTLVQGKNAPDELVGAIEYFNQYQTVDVIIFGRGGGSLEDLQAFNSERVARTIFASKIPIITGIGHEHNTSIADLVADIRAATPSNAAEMTVPDRETVQNSLKLLQHQANQTIQDLINNYRQTVQQSVYTISQHTSSYIMQLRRDIDRSIHSLQRSIQRQLGSIHILMERLKQQAQSYYKGVDETSLKVDQFQHRLLQTTQTTIERSHQQLQESKKLLIALNPSAILKRGYSITYQTTTGQPITTLAELPTDGKIRTQVSDGTFESSTLPNTHQPSLF
jgi:exodeoxyribonuclease VII large subunit